MSHRALVIVGILTAVFVATGDARAQTYDHLQCFKIKDGQKFNDVVVTLSALEPAFQLPANCNVIGKAAELCVPVDKDVVEAGDAPVPPLLPDAQDLSGNFYLCYKIKCPIPVVSASSVTDQFGFRAVTPTKVSKLCVPTALGAVTTSTTTTTTTSTTTTTFAVVTITPPGVDMVASGANFGPQAFDLTASVVLADDGSSPTSDACSSLVNSVAGAIVLIDRGTCNFTNKVVSAQNAGAFGVIIANTDNTFFTLPGTDPTITIPALMVRLDDGNTMKGYLGSGEVAHMHRD